MSREERGAHDKTETTTINKIRERVRIRIKDVHVQQIIHTHVFQ